MYKPIRIDMKMSGELGLQFFERYGILYIMVVFML